MKEKKEEAATDWVFNINGKKWSNNDDTAGDNFGSFLEGAKWQSERMYTEEEMKQMYAYGHQIGMNTVLAIQSKHTPEPQDVPNSNELRDEWINLYKKKK